MSVSIVKKPQTQADPLSKKRNCALIVHARNTVPLVVPVIKRVPIHAFSD